MRSTRAQPPRMEHIHATLRILRGQDAGRSAVLSTDRDMQTGPAPWRITRLETVEHDKTGPNTNTFPPFGDMEYIGHVPLVQIRRGPSLVPGNAIDDRAVVPAIFAGNPIR